MKMNATLYSEGIFLDTVSFRHSFSGLTDATINQSIVKEQDVDIKKLNEGDHPTFELVFRKYYGKVKAFLRVLTKSEEMADELSQHVFINLWSYRKSIDPERNLDAYIYTITRNMAMKALNKKVNDEINIYEYPDLEGGHTPDDQLIASETEILVSMAVERMPPKRKLVYKMSRDEHKTNDEISKELNISKKMVEKHLRDSLADIKEILYLLIMFFGTK